MNPTTELKLLDFSRLELSGAHEVLSFDDRRIELSLGERILYIGGTQLHIDSFSSETTSIVILGAIDSIFFEEETKKPEGNFFSRLFS